MYTKRLCFASKARASNVSGQCGGLLLHASSGLCVEFPDKQTELEFAHTSKLERGVDAATEWGCVGQALTNTTQMLPFSRIIRLLHRPSILTKDAWEHSVAMQFTEHGGQPGFDRA